MRIIEKVYKGRKLIHVAYGPSVDEKTGKSYTFDTLVRTIQNVHCIFRASSSYTKERGCRFIKNKTGVKFTMPYENYGKCHVVSYIVD